MRFKRLYYIFSILLFWSCGNQEQEADEPVDPIAISAREVTSSTFPLILERTGNIRPWEQVLISGNPGTRISNIYADIGDRVNKGELLVQMNQSQLQQARAQFQLAEKDLNRLDTLLEMGSISQQRYDQAETEYANALNNLQMLRENIRLTSPITGVVTGKYFYEGEQYSPSANAPSILTVMDIEPVKVVLNISQEYYTEIEKDMPADVMVDNFPDTTFEGRVWKKYPVIDEASRTFEIEVRIENENRLLRPGMFAEVELPLTSKTGIYVPVSAIIDQPGTSNQYLFLVNGDSVKRITVRTGLQVNDKVLIEEGLQEGNTIVTEGMAKLQEGDQIQIIEES